MPIFEARCDIDRFFSRIETNCFRITPMRSAFAGNITPVGSPLPITGVLGIKHPNRAALGVWSTVSSPRSESNYSAPSDSAHPGVMHNDAICGRVD